MSERLHVAFVAPDLPRWDSANADTLAVPLFLDERPLRGAAGLVDWRLCGRLSRWLRSGRLSGRRGEALLLPPGRRLSFGRVLLYGCGPQQELDETSFRAIVGDVRTTLRKLGARRAAVALPGRASGQIAPRRALELLLAETDRDDLGGDWMLVESPAGQRDMADLLRGRAR